ncbi:MAG: hypothetical protein AB8H86_20240 [Polyangiales bacterium]
MRLRFAFTLMMVASMACGDDDVADSGQDAGADASEFDAETDAALDAALDAADAGASMEFDPDCDPLVPEYCLMPFPSGYYELADDERETGRRVVFGPRSLPRTLPGGQIQPDLFDADGWSTNATLIAYLPGATVTGLANPEDIAGSLEDDSLTVLLDVTSGQRVPHFAELDESVDDPATVKSFLIQPVVPLTHDHDYVVGIRGVVDSAGDVIAPSSSFAAFRDGESHGHPRHAERRAEFEDIFRALDAEGFPRADLQLAWSFHTRSVSDVTGAMLHMRDAAFEAVGDEGPAYRIVSVEEDVNENILRHIEGEIEVPLFLDDPGPGGQLVLGSDGLPAIQGTAWYPFLIRIPRRATEGTPLPITQFGHGLLGSAGQVSGGPIGEFANLEGHVMVAMDWIGMSSDDVGEVLASVSSTDIGRFATVADRLRQGFVNMMLMTRLQRGALASDPALMWEGASVVDPEQTYYYGLSQGGIFGGSLVALSPDIERGILGVPGQPYALLLFRSVDFDAYFSLLRGTYGTGPQIPLLVGLFQMYFDYAEPGTYTPFMNDPLPGSRPSNVLLQVAVADHQVTPLGAHGMARAAGAHMVTPAFRSVFGIEESPAPYEGSGIVEYDFGIPPAPLTNVPPREGDDPHGAVRGLRSAQRQMDVFLRTGVVENFCEGSCNPE